MFAIFLAAALGVQGPYGLESVAEFEEIARAGALDVATPVIVCVRGRVEAHEVAATELGSPQRARDFALEQLAACGFGRAQAKLTEHLLERLPSNREVAERRANGYFAYVRDVMLVKTAEHFKVAPVPMQKR